MQLLTWNIRCQNRGDDTRGCGWNARRERVFATISALSPDVLAVQEALAPQWDDLCAALPDYEAVGVGRDDGARDGEFCALFFRRDRFEVRAAATRWLSPTPDEISVGWDASLKRIATRTRVLDRQTAREIEVWNTHFDHMGAQARLESARMLRRELENLDVPAVLCGDFNASPSSAPIAELSGDALRDSRTHSKQAPQGEIATFRGFEAPCEGEAWRIDYVFASLDWEIENYRVPAPLSADWPPASDHYPVAVELNLKT